MQSVLLVSVVCLVVARCVDSGTGLEGFEPYMVDREIEQQMEKNPVNNDRRRLGGENPVTKRQETEYLSRQDFDAGVQEIQNKMAGLNTVLMNLKPKYTNNIAFRAHSNMKGHNNYNDEWWWPWNFRVTEFNIGEGFDESYGFFLCPYKGIYLFHSHLNGAPMTFMHQGKERFLDFAEHADMTFLLECDVDKTAIPGTPVMGYFDVDKPNYQGILLKRLD